MKEKAEVKTVATLPTRRQMGAIMLGFPFAAQFDSTVAGVAIGAQSYSFRDRGLEACIQAYVDCGLGYAELWHGHLEPKNTNLREWRKSASESFSKEVRAKFDNAGVRLVACSFDIDNSFSDEEIDHIFKMMHWMGLSQMTVSPKLDVVKRLDQFASKYKVYVGLHNHSTMKPNDLSTPSDFATALRNRSTYMRVNLDIGNATAAGWDPVDCFSKHESQITIVHLKDQKLPHDGREGETVPWGRGDTNIRKVLALLKRSNSHILANIEYQYDTPGKNPVFEVRKCFQYCKAALA